MASRRLVRFALVAVALVTASGCGGTSPATPSAPSSEQPVVALTTTHFRVLADRADQGVIRAVADALEANYPRITGDLRTGDLPVIDAWVWQDSASYYADMQRTIGQVYQGSAGYVRNSRALSVLVVSNTPLHAVHEFAHVVSLSVNPTFANNPRWLWETVALYENGQFVNPATLDYMRAGRFPTIADLNAEFAAAKQVYEVGYLLGKFIADAWGMDAFLDLVRANGRVEGVLKITIGELEQRWYAWLRSRYLG